MQTQTPLEKTVMANKTLCNIYSSSAVTRNENEIIIDVSCVRRFLSQTDAFMSQASRALASVRIITYSGLIVAAFMK